MKTQDLDDDPVTPPECLQPGFGDNSKEYIDAAIYKVVGDARRNFLFAEGVQSLQSLLTKFWNCFKIKLASDPPAKVRPVSIKLKPNTTPFRSAQLR